MLTRWIDPLASIDETGVFEWNKELYSKLENLSKKMRRQGPGAESHGSSAA